MLASTSTGLGGTRIGGVSLTRAPDEDICSVSYFIRRLANGIAKPNRYRAEFSLPTGIVDFPNPLAYNVQSIVGAELLTDISMNMKGNINVMCHSCSLPGRGLELYTHKDNLGAPFQAPIGISQYEPVTLTFYADKDLNTRWYFDIWQQTAVNIRSNTINYQNEFVQDFKIYVIDDSGEDTHTIHLLDAFPSSISAIDLSYGDQNSVMNVSVTMDYKYWKAEQISGSVFGARIGF